MNVWICGTRTIISGSCERPLEERLCTLFRGTRRVAYFYEFPDESTFRYRVHNMIQVLEENSDVGAAYFSGAEVSELERALPMIDTIVFGRTRYTAAVDRVLLRARDLGIRVLFDVDDLVFDPNYIPLLAHTLDEDASDATVWDKWFASVGRIAYVMQRCDAIIATNDYLARHAAAFSRKPAHVIPNYLNKEQLQVSEQIYNDKRAKGFRRDGRFHLGYFSGTPTHSKDFDIALDDLGSLLARTPSIHILVVGFMGRKHQLANMNERLTHLPLQNYLRLQQVIGSVEVNLIPLQSNPFTHCKSNLKYFEAAIVGTVSIVSPTYTLEKAVRDQDNGLIARSFEWSDKIEHLAATLDSYPDMAERAFIDARENHTWKQQVGRLEPILFNA
jgi:glycosyltransferase involved in cell wall biosynthesis